MIYLMTIILLIISLMLIIYLFNKPKIVDSKADTLSIAFYLNVYALIGSITVYINYLLL